MNASYTPPMPMQSTSTTDGASTLSDSDKDLLDRTMALFSKPDEGVSPQHAQYLAKGPTYDEWVAGLPDA